MDPLEKALTDLLKQRRLSGVARLAPGPEDFYRYLEGSLQDAELERFLAHLKAHPEDQELVRRARAMLEHLKEAETQSVPASMVEKAKALMPDAGKGGTVRCPHCGKAITPFRNPPGSQKRWNAFWAALAVLSFGLSFAFPRFFVQWSLLAAVSAVKWIFDSRATRTQILIYKALQESGEASSKDLHRLSPHL